MAFKIITIPMKVNNKFVETLFAITIPIEIPMVMRNTIIHKKCQSMNSWSVYKIQMLQSSPIKVIKTFASDKLIIKVKNGNANIDPAKPVIVCTM